MSPKSLAKRRERDAGYTHAARKRSKQLDEPKVELPAKRGGVRIHEERQGRRSDCGCAREPQEACDGELGERPAAQGLAGGSQCAFVAVAVQQRHQARPPPRRMRGSSHV